jgi:DNA-directed RNA polymerase subunit beta'
MRAFHTGGTAATKTELVDEFSRVQNLLLFPETLPGSATLSTLSGKVDKIEKDPAGGHNVYVNGQRHYIPQNRGMPTYGGKALRKGMEVRKGAAISRGPVNPHEMLPLTGVEPVQGYLSNELHTIYGPEGVRRRNTEVVVKALTNLTKIDDPGDHGPYLRGDFASQSEVANFNRKLKGKERPITHTPILKGVNMLPLDMQEDWIARMNHQRLAQTVVEAAQQGWTSKLHGKHPIPPAVFGAEFGKGKPGEY